MPTYTLTLNPGESIILPADAKIITTASSGDTTITSSCGDLPPVEQKECYYFDISRDNDEFDAFYDPRIVNIRIGSTNYTYGGAGLQIVTNILYTIDVLYDAFAVGIPPALFQFIGHTISSVNDRQIRRIFIRTIPSLADSVLIKVVDDQSSPSLGPLNYYQILTPSAECNPAQQPSQVTT